MVPYTPLGGSWLNMTESIQRILVRRALSGEHPRKPDQIIEWLESAAGTGIRHRLSGAATGRGGECGLETGGMLWEEAEPAGGLRYEGEGAALKNSDTRVM